MKTVVALLCFITFFGSLSAIDSGLAGGLVASYQRSTVDYPIGWFGLFENIQGTGAVVQGTIPRSKLHEYGSYGLPPQVTAKMQSMRWSQNLVIESFSFTYHLNYAHLQEFVGAAYAVGDIVVHAVLHANVYGEIVPRGKMMKYSSKICERVATKSLWLQYGCFKVLRPRPEHELPIITQTLRARAYEEIAAAYGRNLEDDLFGDIDPFNLLQEGILRELNKLYELEDLTKTDE